ncbi:Sodium transporter HKT1 [Hibiscus syriacus]|uniref:Sodium transporter HKT1 n=1 Tax=Hibiscus syriacus TaxID=106335 RepID=A0A6A2XVD2_HIBSY|nr:sodium transporter HKT1-like [Hibiscus syriacus]KAE8673910.1 Sodium transporter HKT1 [Hibiscus syriacus]
MGSVILFGTILAHFCSKSRSKLARFKRSCFHVLVFKANPFWVQLVYFIVLSLLGFGALNMSKPRTDSFRPKKIDVLFTSVSAVTVSSMSTVEMEVFSNIQLIIMTVLMLVGGEVFTSMFGLQLARSRFTNHESPDPIAHEMELGTIITCEKPSSTDLENNKNSSSTKSLKYKATRYLRYVVLGYFLVVHVVGSSLVSMYVSLVPSARKILKTKGIEIQTFSFFTVVSTFANCGFVPTNENMIVFKENSGLLLLLMQLVLLGNTLFPACLRATIWVLDKVTKKAEFNYMLSNYEEMGYVHLRSGVRCALLAATVFGFILVQFVLFCSMEWNSDALDGLSSYRKVVGSLFEVVNSRHNGESIVDLSTVSSAILVLFIVMMYLPPRTSFVPTKYQKKESKQACKSEAEEGRSILESVMFSNLSYLTIFVILICITERHKLKEDPLNFNVLNITLEVISAYGNVGFSTGYSCKRRVEGAMGCTDSWAGFAGRWSNSGKFVLIVVMFFGRLKSFGLKYGKAWKLS